MEWLFGVRGAPKYLRTYNGPEFVARAVCRCLEDNGCSTIFIKAGGPWENGYIETFIDKLGDELPEPGGLSELEGGTDDCGRTEEEVQ